MSEYITFNGIKSSDYGVFISGAESFNAPAYALTFQTVPGRNGDLTMDNGRFANLVINYSAFIREGFQTQAKSYINAIMAQPGYKRLVSTYDTTHFRLGAFYRAVDFETGPGNRSGKFDLAFNCKPQRFLTSGETAQSFSKSGTITNPTKHAALPLLRVYGTGTVTVGGTAVTIKSAGSYTDIDCELMDCFEGTTNRNNYVTVTDFPKLAPGSNSVTLGTGITSVIITPRWWEL